MKRLPVVVAAALLAAACARLPVVDDGLDYDARQARLAAIDRWQMRGRLAVDTGERAFQARFRWLQQDEALRLTVRGLLGAGSFEVDGTPAALTLRARGDTRLLTDPEIELSELVGWWLPVTSLSAWLVGRPDGDYPARPALDRAGTLASLEQRLWHLDFDEYQLSDGLLVPRSVRLRHGTLELNLTVDAWEPLPAPTDALN